MGEFLRPNDVAPQELTQEELVARHLDTLHFFIDLPEGSETRLSGYCLRGQALDISDKNIAGAEALRQLGTIRRVHKICLLPAPVLYLKERYKELDRERLVRELSLFPERSKRLITVFDHGDNFVSPQAAREIERILVPGGQCLITCRDQRLAPRRGERRKLEFDSPVTRGLLVHAIATSKSLYDFNWHPMADQYLPNRFVSIYTKPGIPI